MAKGRKPKAAAQVAINEGTEALMETAPQQLENADVVENCNQTECGTNHYQHEEHITRLVQVHQVDLKGGMVLNGITNTCSMYELGNGNSSVLSEISKSEFEDMLKEAFHKIGKKYSRRSIIYNCTNDYIVRDLKRLGFKPVTTYKGYSDSYDVTVFIKNTTPFYFTQRGFWKRLFS